jgi:lipopolysaccharide biosynthesis protein
MTQGDSPVDRSQRGGGALHAPTGQPAAPSACAPASSPRAASDGAPAASPVQTARWQMQLDTAPVPTAPLSGPIGVFVHLFYPDLTEEIAQHLRNIPFDFNLYVSTDTEDKKAEIAACLARFDLMPRTAIKIVPNLGWDLAPFLLGFADEIRRHEIGLKLHGKRSSHQADAFGRQWRAHLLSELVGDADRVRLVVGNFIAHRDLGIVMAQHWKGIAYGVHRVGTNLSVLQALLRRVDLSIGPSHVFEYPSGSMFWFRNSALAPLLDCGIAWSDFRDGGRGVRDGTFAHAVERSFVIFAAIAGLRWAFLPRVPRLARWRRWMRP